MGPRFWVLLRRYCLESTLAWLKYFYLYPDFFSRCFWALNTITVLVMSCVITWLLYCRFEEMPTRITIENQFESVNDLAYPTITLCSPNQMTMSSVEYFNRSFVEGNLTIDLETSLPFLLGFYEQIDYVNEKHLEELQSIFELNRYSISEVMGKMALSCERFLKRCLFEGQLHDCNDLFKPIMTTNGYCCAFNSKYDFTGTSIVVNRNFKNHTVNDFGLYSSLTVVSDYEPDDAIADTIVNVGSIRIMLTDWTEFPVDYSTFLVDTHGEAYVFLSATYTYCSDEVRLLPLWSRNCYFEDEYRLHFFRGYHKSDCDHECYMLAVWKSCDCWLFVLPYLKDEDVCKATDIPCIIKVRKNMHSWMIPEQCHCPRDCVSREYRADLTVGNFLGIPHLIDSQNPFIGLQLNRSTSIINFMFTRPVYKKQKQETVMSIVNLIANLGGAFGLFMGCSGISLLEILFCIYRGIRGCARS